MDHVTIRFDLKTLNATELAALYVLADKVVDATADGDNLVDCIWGAGVTNAGADEFGDIVLATRKSFK